MDRGNRKNKPIGPATPQIRRRQVRQGAAYGELVDLYESGEGVAEAAARCAAIGGRDEARTLIALNNGSMKSPRLTSDGVAAVLGFRVECAHYMLTMTPDPRSAVVGDRPIPADPVLDALKEAGYCVRGERRTEEELTHANLAAETGIPRYTIRRICSGARSRLRLDEADKILDAIGETGLRRELLDTHLDPPSEQALLLEEALAETYDYLWTFYQPSTAEESQALNDEHALYDHMQRNLDLAHLRLAGRRPHAIEWFRRRYGRLPQPIPDTLCEQALRIIAATRAQYQEEAARAETDFPPTDRITSGYVRDLTRRARARGLIQRGQRPRAYGA